MLLEQIKSLEKSDSKNQQQITSLSNHEKNTTPSPTRLADIRRMAMENSTIGSYERWLSW
jgi:hypothetical protein